MAGRDHDRWGPWRNRAKRLLPLTVALGAIAGLLLAASPAQFAAAARHFDPVFAPVVAALSLFYFLMQGVRWVQLLRRIGVKLPVRDIVLLNVAGQSAGLVPGGELTRAVFVSEVSRCEIGATVATVTVQELIYSLLIVLAALPASAREHFAIFGIATALLGIGTVIAMLVVEPVFDRVMAIVRKIPLVKRFARDIEVLRQDSLDLVGHWDTAYWSAISAVQVISTVTMFWIIAQAVDPGKLGWPEAALAYAVAHLAGGLSMSPGGLGGFEAVAIGMLVALGLPFGVAVAVALLQRAGDKGLGTLYGGAAYLIARRRYDLKRKDVVTRENQPKQRPDGRTKAGAGSSAQ